MSQPVARNLKGSNLKSTNIHTARISGACIFSNRGSFVCVWFYVLVSVCVTEKSEREREGEKERDCAYTC